MRIKTCTITDGPETYCYTRRISPREVVRVWFDLEPVSERRGRDYKEIPHELSDAIEFLNSRTDHELREFSHRYAPPTYNPRRK